MEVKAIATISLTNAFRLFLKDLESTPDDVFGKQFGGSSRTVADIVFEVNMVNEDIERIMQGERPSEWPDDGWIKAPAEFQTKEVVVTAFKNSMDKVLSTVNAYSEEDFESPLETEDGTTNRFERCRFMTLHLWYHSGQLNFIQTLIGDDKWHWKD